MAKKDDATVTVLITAGIGLLLMVALIGALASQTSNNTSLTTVTNETLSISSARGIGGALNSSIPIYIANRATGYRANGDVPQCQPGNNAASGVPFSLMNASGTIASNSGVDYTVTNDGTVYVNATGILNNSASNNTYVTYDYCGSNYMASDWGRTLLGVTIGVLALGILIVVIIVAYKLLNRSED